MELSAFDLALQAFGAQVGKLIALVVIVFAVMSVWDVLRVWLRRG